MTKTQDLIFGAVKSWIAETPNLEELAKSDALAHKLILKKHGSQLTLARAIIGRDGMQELASMDLRWLIDAVLNWNGRAGAIIWRHEEWFLREMDALRKVFVGGDAECRGVQTVVATTRVSRPPQAGRV